MRSAPHASFTALVTVLGCSTVGGQDPSEEGMYSDDVQVEVDGVLVQCGNANETNIYWLLGPDGPLPYRVMPVVCMGPQSTPDFDLDDAELIDGVYHFPTWSDEITQRCSGACMAAHDPATNLEPVCLESAFTPNPTLGYWDPSDGPNCDSTLLAEEQGP